VCDKERARAEGGGGGGGGAGEGGGRDNKNPTQSFGEKTEEISARFEAWTPRPISSLRPRRVRPAWCLPGK